MSEEKIISSEEFFNNFLSENVLRAKVDRKKNEQGGITQGYTPPIQNQPKIKFKGEIDMNDFFEETDNVEKMNSYYLQFDKSKANEVNKIIENMNLKANHNLKRQG